MEQMEFFIKLRDACDAVINAHNENDMGKLENAIGKFALLMIQLDALK
jgi:hypothetical protein